MLFDWLQAKALQLGCDVIALDSGVQRAGRTNSIFVRGCMFLVLLQEGNRQMKPINVGLIGIGTVGGGT